MKYSSISLLTISLLIFTLCSAQEDPETDNWDNVMYVSNKFASGFEHWRHSVEFQSRFNNNLGSLEQWQLEYVASYLYKKNWEIVPDIRFTKKPTRTELRPGLGIIYKNLYPDAQIVHQLKYQYDIKGSINDSHGLRYAIFYNKKVKEKLLLTTFAGALFEFGEDWSGFLGMRTGVSAAYIINHAHSVNIGYFYGLINDKTNNYNNIGIINLQLIINISRDYKYLPAKYIAL